LNKTTLPLLITITVLTVTTAPVKSQQFPFQDPDLPADDRVADLVSRMTLEEKIAQLGNQSPAVSRLGIGSYNYWNEALHGVARSGLATSFPQAIALSATWDPDLMLEVATAISDEARVKNNTEGKGLTYWSPTINMARDPRWGRAEENYGEDPFLVSRMAVSFIRGMQGNDPRYLKTVATAKHFACNNVETNRTGISSDVDDRSLREYYLPAFEASVREAGVFSLMSAYNAVNGVPSPANRTLLIHILREEWDFDGYVVSDCDAIRNVWDPHGYVDSNREAAAVSLLNGTDLNCGGTVQSQAVNAVNEGLITEEDVDRILKRVLKARFLLGEFDPPASVSYTSVPDSMLDCQAHRELALRAAREAIVLLKNENGLLPLKKVLIDTIAVLGPNADAVQLGGYSSSPSVSVSPLQGIAAALGIDLSEGVIEAENFSGQNGIQTEACAEGGSNIGYIESGDNATYGSVDFGEGKSKMDVRVASNTQGGLLEVLLDGPEGTALGQISISNTGGWQSWTTLTLDIPVITGIHSVYLEFTGGSGYLYNINWFRFYNEGDEDPLGGSGRILYTKGCNITGSIDQAELDKAIAYAARADVAVVVCGTDLSVADEGTDRSSLGLPGEQEQLIKEVYAANPNTVVVLVQGSSLAVNWAQDSVPAMLTAWYGGQAQGTAIADVLFGDYNPAGRLSATWYAGTADLPSMHDYNIRNNRTYMYYEGTPLYPFGYGLSYTDFTYENLAAGSGSLGAGDSVSVSVDVTNTGDMAGDEVVQLYVHARSELKRPVKELKGFSRVHLQPGETKTVTFYLKHESLKYYDEATRTFRVENGTVDLYIGSSSADIRLQGEITVSEGMIEDTYRRDPFTILQAEHLEGKTLGVGFKVLSPGNLYMDLSGNNSYILFRNLDFSTAATHFHARLASQDEGSTLEIVLDSLDGPAAGTLSIQPTTDPESYETQSCEITGVEGIRDIYIILKGSSTAHCKLDWISFLDEIVGIFHGPEEAGNRYQLDVYPNPAGNAFSVRYSVPGQTTVTIGIYSVLGTMIRSFEYQAEPGSHRFEINCRDKHLESGLYVVRMEADSYTQSRRIMISN
jgi:beta-glucosidase